MSSTDNDTICAIATPPGKSGIGIVRVSGSSCKEIANKILGFYPNPRHAYFSNFFGKNSIIIDKGIALFFEAPNSFTGEDILELQGHGGSFILNYLLKAVIDNGARIARPGEFSERSFMNSKMDLAQLEAVADLIEASTEQAAKSALRTLDGEFSRLIDELVARILELRVYLEASIDFTEEEIDFLSQGRCIERLQSIIDLLESVLDQAKQGAILREGVTVAIAGKPNAGKSSLLNVLSGKDSAIVTDIPGTTRDVLSEVIEIDGLPVHLVDTAGLHNSRNIVEKEGIKRAHKAINAADLILLVIDAETFTVNSQTVSTIFNETALDETILSTDKLIVVFNKIDLLPQNSLPSSRICINDQRIHSVGVSAKTHYGIDQLRDQLKNRVGFSMTGEGHFIARERHIIALKQSREVLLSAQIQLQNSGAIELVAEDLRLAQNFLGEITGKVTSDDLLGEIFSSFCVGK
ncbi:MAG: tRNA uridine-5-carboxymethylaminomethyl(34) synthesis GTPase MnmE [Gammaproteobacteria bacterium]|nr:tRNA uridine-5-carboxymethylaminomethyl(34) synthesis GTPase MnmE [Gammaproteobacteria bacterium]